MAYTFKDGVLRIEKEKRGMSWDQFSIWATPDGNRDRLKNCEYKNYALSREEMQAIAERFGRDFDEIAEKAERKQPDSMKAQVERIEEKLDRLLALWETEGNE